MLDKLLLNNQIITNKKKIQQARIQTINKLVQKIRKLKGLNERKPNNAKITENLDRTPKIMACVKKIKTPDIIRQILILSKKPAAILTNGRAPAEDTAVAMLASNKILVNIVNNLRTLLNLNDDNPGWKGEIMELSKRKKKLLQSGDRKKTRKAVKTTKATKLHAAKKLPWKEENLLNTDAEKLMDAPAKGWKVEPIEESTISSSKPKQVAAKAIKNVTKKETTSPDANQSVDEPASPQEQNQKPVTTIDSFFFTETGDNYVSTVVIDRVQPEAPDDGLIRRERRDNTMRPYQRNTNNRRQSVQNDRTNNRQSFAPSSKVKPREPAENLHPSWAAKQKQKPTITEFKGQKITFDDEGQDKNKSVQKPSVKSSYPAKNGPKAESQDDLHPSWAAKQKLKPSITEFKGKKITFDD